jgi:3-phosphoglycerate kinase
MAKKTVADVEVKGKKVLMRVDFNVPQDDAGNITSDDRIVKALPTIKNILERGAALILMSHLGRPEGERDDAYTLKPVAKRLGELLGKKVKVDFANDCVGEEPQTKAKALKPGQVLLLENLRFHKEEVIKDKNAKDDPKLRAAKDAFARQLGDMADIYVDDAFGTAHRDNASMYTVPVVMKGKPRVIGFLIEKELKFMGEALRDPKHPFVAILGGAKVSDKIGVIQNLIGKVDRIIIGGAMAYTFLKAKGKNIGDSRCENDFLEKALDLLEKAAQAKCEVVLPSDHAVVRKLEAGVPHRVAVGDIDPGWQAVDIGPMAAEEFIQKVEDAKTIVWNGPMGVFEIPPFDTGTKLIAQAVARATDKGAVSIIGGGDSASAVEKLGLQEKISHISTGGGASLEFLEGKKFVCLEVLDEK